MGLLDRFKGGGGFLNNVDGVIVGYKITDAPDFNGKEVPNSTDFNPLWVEVIVRQDGAEKNEGTHLQAGSADDFVISEDGQSITPIEGKDLRRNTPFYRFYESLVANGMPDGPDVPDGEPITFTHIVGTRCRFVQVKDEDGQLRMAAKVKANPKKYKNHNTEGQKKGKDGKFYDQRSLQVSKVYSVGNAVPGTSTPRAGTRSGAVAPARTAVPAKTRNQTSGNGQADDVVISDRARQVLVDILASAKNNTITKAAMNVAVTRALVNEPTLRDPVRKQLYEDAFLEGLAAEGLITYNKADKNQPISLAA